MNDEGSERVGKVEIPLVPPAVDPSEVPDGDERKMSPELQETILAAAKKQFTKGMRQADLEGIKEKLFGNRHLLVEDMTREQGRKYLWAIEEWKPTAPSTQGKQ